MQLLHAGLFRPLSNLHEVETQASRESVGGFLSVAENHVDFRVRVSLSQVKTGLLKLVLIVNIVFGMSFFMQDCAFFKANLDSFFVF